MSIQLQMWDKDIKNLSKVNKLNKNSKLKKLEEYKRIIANTSGVSQEDKDEYIAKCDEAINNINNLEQVEEPTIDASEVTVGENAKHSKQNKKGLKKALATTGIVALIGVAVAGGLTQCSGPEKEKDNTEQTTPSTPDEPVVDIKDTLNFDVENTQVMITNIDNFITESMTKGLELDKDNLANDIESFIDFYVALNINEIGPGYLAELYQNDNKNYLDVFNNFTRWAMVITDEAMMSTEADTYDIRPLVANKEEAAILQRAFDLLAIQHDKGLAGDKEALKANTAEFRTLLEDTLFNENSASFSSPFKVMLAYSAMNMDTLLQNYADISLVDDDVRKMLYEDPEITCAMMMRDAMVEGNAYSSDDLLLLINSSEKNQAALGLGLQLEKKYDQMVVIINTTDKEYTKESSVDYAIDTLVKEVDFSFYKPNQEYREYNDITHEINYPTIVVPEDSVIVDDKENDEQHFISKDELDNYDVDTENKTPGQIQDEYEDKVEDKIEDDLKDDKEFKDNEGNTIEEGEDAIDASVEYAKGYEAGSKQGAIDGNALATKNPTTTGNEWYVNGYAAGYSETYEEAKAIRIEAEKKNQEIKVQPVVTNKEEVIEEGNSIVITQTVVEKKQPVVTTPAPEVEKETTTEIIEEGIVGDNNYDENGIYQVNATSMTYDELYNYYYNILYGSNVEEETVKTK